MSSLDAANRFLAVLEQIEHQLQGLNTALHQEQTALREQDMDTLQHLAKQKEQSTTAVNELEAQRTALLDRHGYGPSPQDMAQYIGTLPASARREARRLWDAIMPLASECERLNKLNGIVLSHQQRRAQSLLSVLRSEVGGGDCYAADGNKEGRQTSQSLARA